MRSFSWLAPSGQTDAHCAAEDRRGRQVHPAPQDGHRPRPMTLRRSSTGVNATSRCHTQNAPTETSQDDCVEGSIQKKNTERKIGAVLLKK
jgi:hypothetical protein